MDEPKTTFELDGNKYSVDVNAFTIDQVRKLLDIDLLSCFENEGKVIAELTRDTIGFVNVIYVLCEESCERHEVDDKQFGRLFADGDKIAEAAECFIAALLNFFPSHQREPLQKLMSLSKEAEAELAERMNKLASDPRLEKALRRQLDKYDEQFSTVLESLESQTRAVAPSKS